VPTRVDCCVVVVAVDKGMMQWAVRLSLGL